MADNGGTWQGPISADEAREHPPFDSTVMEDGRLYLPHSGFWRPTQFIEVTHPLRGKYALAFFQHMNRYPAKEA